MPCDTSQRRIAEGILALGGADSRKKMEPQSRTRGQPSFVQSLSHHRSFKQKAVAATQRPEAEV